MKNDKKLTVVLALAALFAPLALPSSLRPTLERMVFETGAKTSAMPMPASTNGGIRLLYATVGDDTLASQPRAMACSARPVAMSGRLPMRSE